jgi:predicted dehydrogenase
MLPALGPVHRVRIAQRLEPSDLAWQRDPALAGGGSVLLTGVHVFDLLRWMIGRTPDAVTARMVALGDHPLENLFDACFEYDDPPLLAATEVSKFSRSRAGLLEFVGEEGELHVDYLRGTIDLREGRDVERVAEIGDLPTLPIALGFFAHLLRGEIESPVTLHDGIETVRMAEACYRSHASGRVVWLDELDR